MKNPVKSFKNALGKKLHKKHHVHDLSADSKRLIAIWPDGTWTYKSTPPADQPMWDNVVRSLILETWARENFGEMEQSAGRKLNPGMVGMSAPIPSDWLPSERALKALPDKQPQYIHYMIGQLTHLRHIRA